MVVNSPMVWLQTNSASGVIRNVSSKQMQVMQDYPLRERSAWTDEVLYYKQKKLNASKVSKNLPISIWSADTSLPAVTPLPRVHKSQQILFHSKERLELFQIYLFALIKITQYY